MTYTVCICARAPSPLITFSRARALLGRLIARWNKGKKSEREREAEGKNCGNLTLDISEGPGIYAVELATPDSGLFAGKNCATEDCVMCMGGLFFAGVYCSCVGCVLVIGCFRIMCRSFSFYTFFMCDILIRANQSIYSLRYTSVASYVINAKNIATARLPPQLSTQRSSK